MSKPDKDKEPDSRLSACDLSACLPVCRPGRPARRAEQAGGSDWAAWAIPRPATRNMVSADEA